MIYFDRNSNQGNSTCPFYIGMFLKYFLIFFRVNIPLNEDIFNFNFLSSNLFFSCKMKIKLK